MAKLCLVYFVKKAWSYDIFEEFLFKMTTVLALERVSFIIFYYILFTPYYIFSFITYYIQSILYIQLFAHLLPSL